MNNKIISNILIILSVCSFALAYNAYHYDNRVDNLEKGLLKLTEKNEQNEAAYSISEGLKDQLAKYKGLVTDAKSENYQSLTTLLPPGQGLDQIVTPPSPFGPSGRGLSSNIIGSFNSFIDNLSKQFSQISNVIDNMTKEELFAFIHISGCLIIFLSLLSIIGIFYGQFFITYFKINERYPRLKKFFELRRKFQNYYLWFEFTLITIVLVAIIQTNISILL